MSARIVETDVQAAGTPLESYARGTGQAIPAILAAPSHIELVPRKDDPTRFWRNEVGDLILKDPNSERVYTQRKVVLNWHVERGTGSSDLSANIPGLDVDAATGEVLSIDALMTLVKGFIKAQSTTPAEVSTETAGAVMED